MYSKLTDEHEVDPVGTGTVHAAACCDTATMSACHWHPYRGVPDVER